MGPLSSNQRNYNLMRSLSRAENASSDDLSGDDASTPGVAKAVKRFLKTHYHSLDQRKRFVFWCVLAVGFCSFSLKISALGLYIAYFSPVSSFSAAWLGINLTDILITLSSMLILSVNFVKWTRKVAAHKKLSEETSKSGTGPADVAATAFEPGMVMKGLFAAILITNLFSMVSTIIIFVDSSTIFLNYPVSKSYNFGVGLEIISSVSVAASVVFTVLITLYMWWPILMVSQCIILVGSILQFLVTTICILVNMGHLSSMVTLTLKHDHVVAPKLRFVQFYPHLSMLISCAGFVGFGLSMSVGVNNRLSELMVSMINYYIVLLVAGIILALVWLTLALIQAVHIAQSQSGFMDIYIANPILSFAAIVINIICIIAARFFLKRPPTKLRVQVYDLQKLTETQLQSWASLIDMYSKRLIPGSPSGKEALDLMRAYVASPMSHLHCKVLRVYDSEVRDREQARHYEQVRAWAGLDSNSVFNNLLDRVETGTTTATLVPGSNASQAESKVEGGEKLSKNALKRLQKKQQKKAQKGTNKSDVILPVHTDAETCPEKLQESLEFRAELMSTEALVLLTSIEDYDLTSPIHNKFGTVLRKLFGPKSWLKILTVRFGLLATHWPFRETTFYTSPTKKPNARAVAILQAIAKWNNSLPRSERCSMLLNPAYPYNNMENMFQTGGWLTTHVPPSHVVDLRMYRGKTMPEYLKAIKYRNQASAFKSANGEVIETTEFSHENCEIVMDLWHKIAEKRVTEGHTAVLQEPTVDFIMSLGSPENNKHGFRKILFLKVDGKVIASCILFILGDTITSDIQGLDHESARHYKAYFVMMQETIAIALRDGISFVDFGPTTSKPKMDIGASEVPLVGGLYARQPLSTAVSLFANQVNSG